MKWKYFKYFLCKIFSGIFLGIFQFIFIFGTAGISIHIIIMSWNKTFSKSNKEMITTVTFQTLYELLLLWSYKHLEFWIRNSVDRIKRKKKGGGETFYFIILEVFTYLRVKEYLSIQIESIILGNELICNLLNTAVAVFSATDVVKAFYLHNDSKCNVIL